MRMLAVLHYESVALLGGRSVATKRAKMIEVFFSYSHKDEELREDLEKHLSILKRDGVITAWYDRRIGAGREWEGEISEHVNTAGVILLLISADFLASDYCYDVEVKRAMERHEAREARVIPVVLRAVDWKGAPFRKLQALPRDARPVTSWPNRDEAFADVAKGIRAAVEELVAEPEKITDQRSPPPERAETEIRETVEGAPVRTDGSPEAETEEKPPARSPYIEALDAMIDNDFNQFDSKMEEAIAAEEDDERRLSLRALRLSRLYDSGRTEKLEELRALRAEHPESHYPVMWLGESFEVAGDYARAAALYGEALTIDTLKERHRLTLLRRQSGALAKAKEFQEAEEKLLTALAEMTSTNAQKELHTALADLYEIWSKWDLFHWHLEQVIEENPGAADVRFRLAYSYSETGWPLLALHHYDILVHQRGETVDRNNLGVELHGLDMPITAMYHYRTAARGKYGLAAANYARNAAEHGVVETAREILAEAMKDKDADESVYKARSDIADWEKGEEERLQRIREGGRAERALFMRRLDVEGENPTAISGKQVEGVWESTEGDITFETLNEKLGGRFKRGVWDWKMVGDLKRRTYTFSWENDGPSKNQSGDGYFLFTDDDEFVGILRHTPKKGEVLLVSGRKKPAKQEPSGDRVDFGEIVKNLEESLRNFRPETGPKKRD